MMRRGFALLGGTFDPVHRGHLALAEAALEALPILRVDFLPAGDPWQKKRVTSAFHRVTMLRRALQYDPRFRVDEREVLRPGKTYTIDTLEAIRRRTGDSIPVVLLLGSDQWNNFSTWVRWREITDFAHIAVAAREGVETALDEGQPSARSSPGASRKRARATSPSFPCRRTERARRPSAERSPRNRSSRPSNGSSAICRPPWCSTCLKTASTDPFPIDRNKRNLIL